MLLHKCIVCAWPSSVDGVPDGMRAQVEPAKAILHMKKQTTANMYDLGLGGAEWHLD